MRKWLLWQTFEDWLERQKMLQRQALDEARENRQENRETQTLEINRGLLTAANGSATAARVAALVAIVALGLTIYQAWQSRKDSAQAREDAQQQFTKQIGLQGQLVGQASRSADAASVAARAAKVQSDSSKQQTEIMGKQMALSQQIERPWVGIDGDILPRWQTPQVPKVPGDPILSVSALVKLQNFGQSVASWNTTRTLSGTCNALRSKNGLRGW